jgi:hypothetical protein
VADSLDPAKLAAPTLLALAVDLQSFELDRKQALLAG